MELLSQGQPAPSTIPWLGRAALSPAMALRALCARLPPEVVALTRSHLERPAWSRSLSSAAAASPTTTKTFYATTPIFYVNAGMCSAQSRPGQRES